MAEARKSTVYLTCAALVLAAFAGALVLFVRQGSAQARQAETLKEELSQGPVVRTAVVKIAAAERTVTLPAEVRAERRATLYAKVSGYVKEVRVERGDKVKQGQELATLESPDLDEQVRSAQAELMLREQQLERARKLSAAGRVSLQEREQAEEAVKVSRAGLSRARTQKAYQVIRAPFDGTITARFADPGALLPAATGSTSSAQPILEVAQLDKLRIALHLAQDDAAKVTVGAAVSLQIANDQAPLEAHISRISHALDPRTRTMLCEIDLVNPPAGLYPGAFVDARLPLRGNPRPLVPSEALIAVGGQTIVPLVEGNHVHFQRVRVGSNDGTHIEVIEGLRGGEVVALNLGADVSDGSPVRPQTASPQPTR